MDQYLETLNDSNSQVLEQYDALRAIWGDILQGFSYYAKGDIYIKHLDDIDHAKISKIQTDLVEEFLEMGVPTRQERLDFITKETGEWSQDDEDEITSAEYFLIDNEPTYQKLTMDSQRNQLGELINKNKKILRDKRAEKEVKIGTVAETKAEKLANAYYVYYSLFKDENLTERFWKTRKEFDEIEDEELTKYIIIYNQQLSPFSLKNFKKISIMPFTLNLASYCKDQGMFFYGKPITQFSNFQLGCFTKIMRNTFILRETKTTGSPEITNELMMQTLLDWYEHEYMIIMAENASGSGAVTRTQVT